MAILHAQLRTFIQQQSLSHQQTLRARCNRSSRTAHRPAMVGPQLGLAASVGGTAAFTLIDFRVVASLAVLPQGTGGVRKAGIQGEQSARVGWGRASTVIQRGATADIYTLVQPEPTSQ